MKVAGTSPSTGTTGTSGPHGHGLGLVLERVTAEKLNRSLWRWLCVYHRL
jgi:hypothetical protein